MEIVKDLENINEIPDNDYKEIIELYKDVDRKGILNLRQFNQNDNIASLIRMIDFVVLNFINSNSFKTEKEELDKFVNYITGKELSDNSGWQRLRKEFKSLIPFILDEKKDNLKEKDTTYFDATMTTKVMPVFDLEKDKIVDALFPTTVEITTFNKSKFTFDIYESEIESLIECFESSLKKIATMRKKYE